MDQSPVGQQPLGNGTAPEPTTKPITPAIKLITPAIKPSVSSGSSVKITAKAPRVLTFDELDLGLKWIRMLIIGDQGSGKTRLATSILDVEGIEGVLYIDADRGISTGARYIQRHPGKIKRYKQVNPDNAVEVMTDLIDWLEIATDREKIAAHNAGKSKTDRDYIPHIDTVVIDSVSFLGDRAIGELGEGANAVMTGVIPDNNQITSFAEYNIQKVLLEGWVYRISGLPCHLIATCHSLLEKNERKLTWMPILRLPRQLARSLPSYFRQIHWLSIQQGSVDPRKPDERPLPKHILLCRPEGDTTEGLRAAKDCSDTLPYEIENPTMEKLFGYFFKQD